MKNISTVLLLLFAGGSVGFVIGDIHGGQSGAFRTALAENKLLQIWYSDFDSSSVPAIKECLKGKIYTNIALHFPNDPGYLIEKEWNYGPVDRDLLGDLKPSKDPTARFDSFQSALQHVSK